MRLAYADPPYPGKAHLYAENEEVDHEALIAQLCAYDGWALMSQAWERFQRQEPIVLDAAHRPYSRAWTNRLRRANVSLPGLEGSPVKERSSVEPERE